MSITARVTGRPIKASVSSSKVVASVSGSKVVASVSGGVGPRGPAGQSDSITDLTDVLIESVSDGDLLRYSSGKFRNYNETLITDGGNF